ncbi:hypothetical protein Tco_1066401 [Tanacetum coccineum]|uniref:Uncharacterized protein n=1 Tax=Tanacetum coccineum TaxID=301880 RepID=A0ABQ5HA07_9ASTR
MVEGPVRECNIDLSSAVKLKEYRCKAILQQKGDEHEFWTSCDLYNDQFDGGDLIDSTKKKCYWCCLNDDKRIDVAWEGLSLNDWIRLRYGKVCRMTKERILNDYWRQEVDENQDDMIDMSLDPVQEISLNTEEYCEDLENFRDEKMELILDIVLYKLDDGWFSGTVKDEEDLDGIVDYLELNSHDGFIDIDDEAYKNKMYELLGMTYKTPPSIVIKKVEVTRYTIGPGESYTRGKILQIDELPKTSANVVSIRAELMKEMDTAGSVQREM